MHSCEDVGAPAGSSGREMGWSPMSEYAVYKSLALEGHSYLQIHQEYVLQAYESYDLDYGFRALYEQISGYTR